MAVDAARAKSLFLAAPDLADSAERAAYLGLECGGDAELLAGSRPCSGPTTPRLPAARVPGCDQRSQAGRPAGNGRLRRSDRPHRPVLVGKGKLIEEIGEGGMGSVYMAQQTEPVKRAVAVKVVKAGMDSRAVLARFEAERQA